MARSITTRSTNPKIMDDNIKILDDALAAASTPPAEDVSYDNTDSGRTADDVQAAIDELESNIRGIQNSLVKTKSFTVTTSAAGGFYLDNLTENNSIILQISSTEQYYYLLRVGTAGAWVGCALSEAIQPIASTEIHVTVKYFELS